MGIRLPGRHHKPAITPAMQKRIWTGPDGIAKIRAANSIRWVKKNPTPSAFTTCTAMYGSGVEDDWHDNYNGAPTDGSAWVDTPRQRVPCPARRRVWLPCRVLPGGLPPQVQPRQPAATLRVPACLSSRSAW